jgi:hypothetical protein
MSECTQENGHLLSKYILVCGRNIEKESWEEQSNKFQSHT